MTWPPPPAGGWSPDPSRPPTTPIGAVAWQPAGPPVGVPAPPPGSAPPPGPPSGPRPANRRRALIAGVVALVVVALGTTVGVVLGTGGDDTPPPAAAPPSVTTASGSSVDTGTSAPATAVSAPTTAARTTATPTTAAPPAAQAYSAPGGLTVLGPVGWVADGSANNGNIRDFDVPGSTARLASATFRIGVGNATPSGSFEDEVDAAANFQVTDKNATIVSKTYTSFLGTTAGDIVYSYFNADYGVQRQGVERIWRHADVTLIIQSSDVETNWPRTSAVFQQLTASASVS